MRSTQERLRLAAPALLAALQELAEAVKCDSPPETLKLKMDAAEAAIKTAEEVNPRDHLNNRPQHSAAAVVGAARHRR